MKLEDGVRPEDYVEQVLLDHLYRNGCAQDRRLTLVEHAQRFLDDLAARGDIVSGTVTEADASTPAHPELDIHIVLPRGPVPVSLTLVKEKAE